MPDPFARPAGRAALPHRRPRRGAAGRRARVPRPHRPPGEAPRLPHRARRDRGGARPAPRGRPGRGRGPRGRSRASSASSPTSCPRGAAPDDGSAPRPPAAAAAGVHGAGRLRRPRRPAPHPQRQGRPQGAPRPGRRRRGQARYVAPRDARGSGSAAIWHEVLGLDARRRRTTTSSTSAATPSSPCCAGGGPPSRCVSSPTDMRVAAPFGIPTVSTLTAEADRRRDWRRASRPAPAARSPATPKPVARRRPGSRRRRRISGYLPPGAAPGRLPLPPPGHSDGDPTSWRPSGP